VVIGLWCIFDPVDFNFGVILAAAYYRLGLADVRGKLVPALPRTPVPTIRVSVLKPQTGSNRWTW
jgi:hypothetical protein